MTYEVKTVDANGEGLPFAVSALDGSVIGTVEMAEALRDLGIVPEKSRRTGKADVGFCDDDQLWYGWSEAEIRGFGVGTIISRGDAAYIATDWDDLLDQCKRLVAKNPGATAIQGLIGRDEDGDQCIHLGWKHVDGDSSFVMGAIVYPPDTWGRGEWRAETLDEAREMAETFAESAL